ncbi:MAG: rhodanese-like domain-containing protein [Alphaproteobacteria bacterium]|nr:rhodanese-like domain-containing protein [Alphaproteobacteria bacterium]
MAYKGDLSAPEAWRLLSENPAAQLVDVRTRAEWTFVGVPDLAPLGRKLLLIEWHPFPNTGPNPEFGRQVEANAPQRDAPLLFLCRTGGRSLAAANAMTTRGYTACYNVAGGFEGDLDGRGHRGLVSGWKAAKLPWTQS